MDIRTIPRRFVTWVYLYDTCVNIWKSRHRKTKMRRRRERSEDPGKDDNNGGNEIRRGVLERAEDLLF
jgi:hypothetical protein